MVSKFSILCKLYLLKKIFQPLVAQYVNGYYWTMQTYLISHLYVWGRIIARAKCSMSIVINSSSPGDNLLKKWIKKLRHGRIRQVAIPISCRTSWRNESSNVRLVILDKLLYYTRNLSFWKIRTHRRTGPTYWVSSMEIKNHKFLCSGMHDYIQ